MNNLSSKNTSFGRHESFPVRFTWIPKALINLNSKPDLFESEDATVILGVGKNMVSSIKYWIQALKLVDFSEKKCQITSLGDLLFNNQRGVDPYLEDDSTIWLLHWLLCSNPNQATSIYWFFNHYHKQEFTHKELTDSLQEFVKHSLNSNIANKTLDNDISLILRMYQKTNEKNKNSIEDNIDSPFSLLNLVQDTGDSRYFQSKYEHRWDVPLVAFAYATNQVFDELKVESIDISQILKSSGGVAAPGSVFRLNEEGLLSKLEKMVAWLNGFFELRESAGIQQLYRLKKISTFEILNLHYKKQSI